jgi:hypothetical protein
VFVNSVSGTDANRKITCEIRTDSTTAGAPGATVLGSVENTGGFSAATIEWTGLNASVTKGVKYWVVLRNTSVAPTVDYVTLRVWLNQAAMLADAYAFLRRTSTDGTTWTGVLGVQLGWQLEYSDGTLSNPMFISGTSAGYTIYGTREAGNQFTLPAYASANIVGVQIFKTHTGSPATRVVRLYSASNALLLESSSIRSTSSSSGQMSFIPFAKSYIAAPGEILNVVLADNSADSSSNNWAQFSLTVNSSADYALKPLNMRAISRADTSSNFTVTQASLYEMALVLDSLKPFIQLPLNRRKFNNQR